MSEDTLTVEATGETVGEAKWSALRELEKLHPGVDKGSVRFDVVSEGERGLLGVGYEPARVVASVTPVARMAEPEAESDSPTAGRVRELLEHITRSLGIAARVAVIETDESIVASCTGRDLGLLIGKHGQTIDAIQYLVNAIVYRGGSHESERKPIVVDAAGYRARRDAVLDALAVRCAERAVSSRTRIELEPMTAVERKVVHVRLKDFPGVETLSEGTEPNRFVVVVPVGE